MADTITKKRRLDRNAPGTAGTGDASFDQALDQAERDMAEVRAAMPKVTKSARPAPVRPTDIRAADSADMAARQNLPRYGSTPVVPDTARRAAGVPLPAQQFNFPDAVAANSKIARANKVLGGSLSRPLQPRTGAGLDSLAADLQSRNRNAPASFRRPGLTPSLAPLDPVSREVADWQNTPGHNTLTPQEFLARRGRPGTTQESLKGILGANEAAKAIGRDIAAEPIEPLDLAKLRPQIVGGQKPWSVVEPGEVQQAEPQWLVHGSGPRFGQEADPGISIDPEQLSDAGELGGAFNVKDDEAARPARSTMAEAMRRQQQRYLADPNYRYTNSPKYVDPSEVNGLLAANREKYLQDRSNELASRQALVTGRQMMSAVARWQRMHPNMSGAGQSTMGLGTQQQYDPVQSAMFGATLGAMTGNPGLAADFARGAGEFNARSAEQQARQQESALDRTVQGSQLAELTRHNQANEGLTGRQLAEDSARRQQEAITRDPLYIYALMLPEGDQRRGRIMQILTQRYGSAGGGGAMPSPSAPAGATVTPVGGGIPPGIFEEDPDADIRAGKMTDAAYQRMRSMHPANVLPVLPDWFPGTEDLARANLFTHYKKMFPGVDPRIIGSLSNQYYDRFYNTVGAAAGG